MSKSRPRDHTVLPKWHLRSYFGDTGFQTYDLKDREWKSWGPQTFGTIRGYYDPEIEAELGKIESRARQPVEKLASRCLLDHEERHKVAEYIAASLFRNSSLIDEIFPTAIESAKRELSPLVAVEYPGVSQNAVDETVDLLMSRPEVRREMHGAWLKHAEEYPRIAENIFNLTWQVLYVESEPDYLLLTDRPFIVHQPASATEALVTFPISSDVMLRISYGSHEQWMVEPAQSYLINKYARLLVARAKRFVAAPFRDPELTEMVKQVRAADTL